MCIRDSHGSQSGGREHGPEDVFAQSRKEFDHLDSVGQPRGDAQLGRNLRRMQDGREVVGDVDPDLRQRRIIVLWQFYKKLHQLSNST